MDKATDISALEELRADQLRHKKWSKPVFITLLLATSAAMIVLPMVMPRPVYHVVLVASIASIFGLIFNGRFALILTRRRYKQTRPHHRLAQLSEPEDINLSLQQALEKVEERQQKELDRRGLR